MSYLTERLLNAQYHNHEEDCCCGECSCENEHDHEEIVEKSLSESEIEEIISEKYSEKDEKTKKFIRKSLRIHGLKYDYSKTIFVKSKNKVIISCLVHGDFEQTPDNHLSGKGCAKCSGNKKLTTEEFIVKARKVHGDKYDYSKVNYVNANTNVIIICPIHGEFLQTPTHHLGGSGCPMCANNVKLTTEQFIERANEIQGRGTYLYNRVNYVNSNTPVEIYDPLYEEYFFQSPEVHLRGCGNPNRKMSSGERQVYLWLKSMNIDFNREVLLENTFGKHGNGIIVDFIIDNYNNYKIIIEYNGGQHYKFTTKFHSTVEDFNAQLKRDEELRDYCKVNSVILIELPFILKTSTEISDFLTKTIIEGIDPSVLVDYDSLYIFDDNST